MEQHCTREQAMREVQRVADSVEEAMESIKVDGVRFGKIRQQDRGDSVVVLGTYEDYTEEDSQRWNNPEPHAEIKKQVRDLHDAVSVSTGSAGYGDTLTVHAEVHSADWVWGRFLDSDGAMGRGEE